MPVGRYWGNDLRWLPTTSRGPRTGRCLTRLGSFAAQDIPPLLDCDHGLFPLLRQRGEGGVGEGLRGELKGLQRNLDFNALISVSISVIFFHDRLDLDHLAKDVDQRLRWLPTTSKARVEKSSITSPCLSTSSSSLRMGMDERASTRAL